MALDFVREVWQGRTGSFDISYRREYQRKFEVAYTTTLESTAVVLTTPGIPRRGEQYTPSVVAGEYDLASRCINVEATQRDGDWRYWDVTATYSNQWSSEIEGIVNNPDILENPLLRPATISFQWMDYDQPVYRDLRGIPTVNSAGDRFENPLTLEAGRLSLVYERNEIAFNITFASLYNKAVNSDVFLGVLPGRAKVHSLSATQEHEGFWQYYKVRKELHFRQETFNDYVLDWGPNYLNSSSNLVVYRDNHGAILSGGGPLNGKGGRLADTSTTLFEGIGSTDTRLILADASTFPAVDLDLREWSIKIGSEVMLVTEDRGGGNYTVVRGYAGTTAATHNAAAAVTLEPVMLVFQLHRRLPFNVLDILI